MRAHWQSVAVLGCCMRYIINNWADHQHYKDRCPPWIKLHNSMLTSEVWVMGTDQTRTLAIACMLLAARDKENDGSFNGDPEYVKRFGYLNSKPDFKQLIEYGFINLVQDASTTLAECNTEKSREETEKSRVEKTAATFVLPDWIDKTHWDIWVKARKKMNDDQKQMQVSKLKAWKDEGLDFAGALANAAANGTQGLFLPQNSLKPKIPKPENFAARDYGEGIQKL